MAENLASVGSLSAWEYVLQYHLACAYARHATSDPVTLYEDLHRQLHTLSGPSGEPIITATELQL